jgi:N-acetylmuramoyl-L-alanine amidase
VCILIAAAVAGGVWWKLKPSQLANKEAPAEKMAPKPMGTAAKAKPRELSKYPMVTGIQHWSSADSSTVVLNLEDQVQYEAHRLANPDRIYFDLHDTQLASNLAWKSIEVGDALLERIRVAQPVTGITRIVLETKTNTDFSVSLEPNPYRLVVEVRKVAASPKGVQGLRKSQPGDEAHSQLISVPQVVVPMAANRVVVETSRYHSLSGL